MRHWFVLLILTIACGPLSAQVQIQDFRYSHVLDPITDADRSTLVTPDMSGARLRNAALMWRCNGSDAEIVVAADEFLHHSTPVPVRWRFDADPPSAAMQWAVSTDGTGAFAPDDMVAWFTTRARDAGKVVVRVSDFRGVDYTLEFSLRGLTVGLERMDCAPARLDLGKGAYYPEHPAGPRVIVSGRGVGVDAAAQLAIGCEEGRLAGALRILGAQEFFGQPRLMVDGAEVKPNPIRGTGVLSSFDAMRLARRLWRSSAAEIRATLPDFSEFVVELPVAAFASISDLPCGAAATEPEPSENAEFIGNPNTRTFFPLNSDCWRGALSEETAVYFSSEREAKEAGYRRSALCRMP